ncbi:MAG TPA: proline racemase family protein [Rhizomicrobium sp.]|jgi:4-hydroxyproline epimerase|nr:proline racemase family protein [Rhizomicrobium sp.]
MHSIRVIDSHTAGEPTRLVLEGGPNLGDGPMPARLQRFREHFDDYRSAIVNEPRGSDPLVGALLVPPHRADCQFGVIYFNNVGYLGMCGHGTIGLMASLKHAGKIMPGAFKIDTPVGAVDVELGADGRVSVANVVSHRSHANVAVEAAGIGRVVGDVAWGGNWFFLVSEHGQAIDLPHVETMTDFAWRVRAALNAQGHPLVDHVELFGDAVLPGGNSRNFVLCPGKAYDRSPCGTGTSAKLACLAADGKLQEGATWVQESLIGSSFEARYRWHDRSRGEVVPIITGMAYVTGENLLRLDPDDPFCWGIRA